MLLAHSCAAEARISSGRWAARVQTSCLGHQSEAPGSFGSACGITAIVISTSSSNSSNSSSCFVLWWWFVLWACVVLWWLPDQAMLQHQML